MIKAVIFDLDGVITDTAEYHYLGWKRMAKEACLDFDRQLNERLRGVSRQRSLEIILEYNGKNLSTELFSELMKKKNEYYKIYLDDITERDYLPGIKKIIKELREKGIKTAIASASKNAVKVIKNLNASQLFDYIADGYSVINTKPAPDLFLFAAEKLGEKPSQTIVFEDAKAGIEAAIKGGFLCVGIGPEERVGKANLRYETTKDIDLNQILSINRQECL